MGNRVVQWTTGNVGQRSVRAVVAHPDLELVGCYAWSADKVGRARGPVRGGVLGCVEPDLGLRRHAYA